MAIRILNVGAAAGVLSVSFNKGIRGEPGRMVVKKIGSGTASFAGSAPTEIGGFSLGGNWKLLSSMTGEEPGGSVTTQEFIDGSYILDTKNIILFKRNINGADATYSVTKTVKIPSVSFSFSGSSGSFTISMIDKDITVERKKTNNTSGGVLGEEEWSSNPCEPSTVSYNCSEALSLIGVGGGGGSARCSFEGSYRSVLGSIAAKLGKTWYWDGAGPKFFDNSNSSLPGAPGGQCTVYSSQIGQTLEGSMSIASWTYQRLKTPNRSAKRTVEVYEYPHTGATLHPEYPTDQQFIYDTVPSLQEHDAYEAANGFNYGPLRKLGNEITDDFTMLFATLVFQATLDFMNTFGIQYTYQGGVPALGTGLREQIFAAMGVREEYTRWGTSGFVRIVGGWSKKYYEKEPTTEIFYAAPTINSHTFSGNGVNWKTVDVNVEPSPERRGLNKFADTFEDQNGIVRIGTWRGVSVDVKEQEPGTGTDSEAWGMAVADCMGGVSGEVLRYIMDGPLAFKEGRGAFKNLLDNGYQVWYVVPPNSAIEKGFGGGGGDDDNGSINNNDATQTADYVDPNEFPELVTEEQQESEDEAKEYDDPCEDLISKATDAESEGDDKPIIIGDKKKRPGITGAAGTRYSYSVSARGVRGEVAFVTPSKSDFQWKVKTTYQFSVIAEGTTDVSNVWTKTGSIDATEDVLNHSIIVTEIPSPEQVPEDVEVPAGASSPGPVPVAEYVVNGFYLPTDHPALDSLSATLDPQEGLVVSYRYKGQRPQPVSNTLVVSPNAYQVNINVS